MLAPLPEVEADIMRPGWLAPECRSSVPSRRYLRKYSGGGRVASERFLQTLASPIRGPWTGIVRGPDPAQEGLGTREIPTGVSMSTASDAQQGSRYRAAFPRQSNRVIRCSRLSAATMLPSASGQAPTSAWNSPGPLSAGSAKERTWLPSASKTRISPGSIVGHDEVAFAVADNADDAVEQQFLGPLQHADRQRGLLCREFSRRRPRRARLVTMVTPAESTTSAAGGAGGRVTATTGKTSVLRILARCASSVAGLSFPCPGPCRGRTRHRLSSQPLCRCSPAPLDISLPTLRLIRPIRRLQLPVPIRESPAPGIYFDKASSHRQSRRPPPCRASHSVRGPGHRSPRPVHAACEERRYMPDDDTDARRGA